MNYCESLTAPALMEMNYFVAANSAQKSNTAVQDDFQLYTHNFILCDTGECTVVQHGMQVPAKVYDETIAVLRNAVEKAKLGLNDKNIAIKKLHEITSRVEENYIPNNNFNALIEKERNESCKYGGRTAFDSAKPPQPIKKNIQLKLF